MKFGMENSKLVGNPMVTRMKLTKNDVSPLVNPTRYKSMIGGLLYLTQTRLHIMNVFCIVSTYQSDPRENHESVVKRIFRYLQGTTKYSLWYHKNDDFILCAYIDANWVGDTDDQKSTFDGSFFLGKKLVSWISKKKSCISLSIVEVEYVVVVTNYNQILWMKQMLKDIRIDYDEPVFIHYDNSTNIDMSKNLVFHSKTKNVSINYNFFKEKVEAKEVKLLYVNTKEQIVHIFTKPLPRESFKHLRDRLEVSTPPIET